MKHAIQVLVAAFLLSSAPVMAKEGHYLGLFLLDASVSGSAGSSPDTGSGYGLRAGLGFNRYFSVEGSYGNSGDLTAGVADFKINFPLTKIDTYDVMTVEPYINAGYGVYDLDIAGVDAGSGLRLGFGVEVYLFKELSIQGGWSKANVNFDSGGSSFGLDIKTVDVGLVYHFL